MGLGQILFGFEGRIRRTVFWLANIGAAVALGMVWMVMIAMAGAAGALGSIGSGGSEAVARMMAGGVLIWLAPIWVLGLWISVALAVKRCHDRNYPGVMVLISFVPLIGWLWMLIDLGFIDGTPGPNQYGASPKGILAPPIGAGAITT